jgi:predicted O-methyltransferase YrrM
LRGWIPERFDIVSDKTFSIVHIDVDLYQPTRDALEFFYPRLNPGGLMICDDYGSVACPGAKKAVDDFCKRLGKVPAALTTGQAVIF